MQLLSVVKQNKIKVITLHCILCAMQGGEIFSGKIAFHLLQSFFNFLCVISFAIYFNQESLLLKNI